MDTNEQRERKEIPAKKTFQNLDTKIWQHLVFPYDSANPLNIKHKKNYNSHSGIGTVLNWNF